jgi:hypothetical protein
MYLMMMAGLYQMGSSSFEEKSMSHKTPNYIMTLSRCIMMLLLLDTLVDGRPLNWSLEITGGLGSCDTLWTMCRGVTNVIALKHSLPCHQENCNLIEFLIITGKLSQPISSQGFLPVRGTTLSGLWLIDSQNECMQSQPQMKLIPSDLLNSTMIMFGNTMAYLKKLSVIRDPSLHPLS